MKKSILYSAGALALGILLALSPLKAEAAPAGQTPVRPVSSGRGWTGESSVEGASAGKGLPGRPSLAGDFHFDMEEEKEKLAQAVKKMDEFGISPEKLLGRFRDFINRRETWEKAGRAVRDLKENAGKLLEKAVGRDGEAEAGPEDSLTRTIGRERDRVREEVRREAEKKLDEAVDKTVERAKDLAADEIDRAAEAAREGIRE